MQESMSLLSFRENHVLLDMQMTGRDFAKSRLYQYVDEVGYRALPDEKGDFTFVPWTFSSTEEKDNSIYVQGTCPQPGVSLIEEVDKFLSSGGEETHKLWLKNALVTFNRAADAALSKKLPIGGVGPAQCILCNDGSMLFLPPTLLTRAIESRSKEEYSRLLGCWIHPVLEGACSLRFTQSVCGYFIGTGSLPYDCLDTEKRMEDYRDNNFVPIQYKNPSVSPLLAQSINNYLSVGAGKHNISVKQNTDSCVIPGTEIPWEEFEKTDKLFFTNETSVKEYTLKLDKKIDTVRFVRKYSTGIKILAGVLIFFFGTFLFWLWDRQDNYITTGLTGKEVGVALYTGMNNRDLVLAEAVCKGKGAKQLVNIISNFYLSSKIQEGVAGKTTLSFAQLFYFLSDTAEVMPDFFGLSNFCIDGEKVSLDVYPYIRKDNPIPVETSHSEGSYTVTYYMAYTQGEDTIVIEYCTDTVKTEFLKDSWYVTEVVQKKEPVLCDFNTFRKEYSTLLKENNGSVVKTAEKLRETYPWIPREEELILAEKKIQEKFGLMRQ